MDGTMMVVLIVAISMGAWMIVEIWKSFFGWLQSRQSSKSGSSLKTSELEAIIHNAVRDATQPLEEKIDRLESRLDEPPLLDDPEMRPQLESDYEERSESGPTSYKKKDVRER